MNIKLDLIKNEIAKCIIDNVGLLDIDVDKAINTTAIKILSEIKQVIINDDISDFDVVEEIVRIFEKNNISAGSRHDF